MVRENVQRVREEISRSGGTHVSLVAVTKSLPLEALYVASECGCDAVGENYIQELRAKMDDISLRDALSIPVHFIGSIQTNKIRHICESVDLWQSVDRPSVITELAKRSQRPVKILIQINTTGEESKSGCEPSQIDELRELAQAQGIEVKGLMTMGPTDGDLARTRQAFRKLRHLATTQGLEVCSMGMSGDYAVAVDEGSTMVRIGQALFGSRG